VRSDQAQRLDGVRATVASSVILITVTSGQYIQSQEQGPTRSEK